MRIQQPFRQARSSPATVSAAQGERRLGQEISPQWEISKLASGKEPTGLFARKHLLVPYTGEAIMRKGDGGAVSLKIYLVRMRSTVTLLAAAV